MPSFVRRVNLKPRSKNACQQRDLVKKQMELHQQRLYRVETMNRELSKLVAALEAEKRQLEQQPLGINHKLYIAM